MGIGLSLGHRQEQRNYIRLTASQRLIVDQEILQTRLDLVESIQGRKFEPKGLCPTCGYALSGLEIMRGFNNDPNDLTTICPKCRQRFAPLLRHGTASGWSEIRFYCPTQTLERLPALQNQPLEIIKTEHQAVYYSAVVHFGGLGQAFARIGLSYAFAQDLDWRKQAEPFLGKLPDTVIAEVTGTTRGNIGRLRRAKGLRAFTRWGKLDEIEKATTPESASD